ncbi:hypothetical protein ACCAA_1560001 [Candidatus Accumulibacter aalborgensis]|uniref:Uncharacterized protein n=1 Tax=Candidatus Accumulibacter aalborgensis TaxID=1860102 RepID=A0A1A8XKR0_9PROT|nr:hypothetical protein ACCAA_1560001 [Candidatus Accumulibacter aalborgensis]
MFVCLPGESIHGSSDWFNCVRWYITIARGMVYYDPLIDLAVRPRPIPRHQPVGSRMR